MEIIFLCVFFAWLGWYARERWAINQLKNLIDDMEDSEDEKIHIIVDISDNQIFVYEKNTLQYLAHGKTESDITNILKQRFPGKTFAASSEDMLKLTSFTK
jgi:hypothetical protein